MSFYKILRLRKNLKQSEQFSNIIKNYLRMNLIIFLNVKNKMSYKIERLLYFLKK